MNDAVARLRTRPKTTIVLAVLLIGAGLTLGLAREALATYTFTCSSTSPCGKNFPRDTDGYVQEGEGDLNAGPPQPRDWHVLGQTSWYSYSTGTSMTIDDYIKYDWPETDYINVPRWMVQRHEHAHSRGWEHWETPDSSNDAYNPDVTKS